MEQQVYSLPQFAKAHGMSLRRLYDLLELDCGPVVTRNGRRPIIFRRDAEKWCEEWSGKELPSRPKRPEEAA
jgi:hypothetical protein